jgi:hypothetical protein
LNKTRRIPLRDQLAANAKALRGLMALSGKPVPTADPLFAEPPLKPARPPVTRATRAVVKPVEKDIQNAIVAYLRTRYGAVVIRYNSGVMESDGPGGKRFTKFNDAPGHSDLGGVLPGGRAFYMEIKRPGNRPTEKQQAFLDRMAKAGAIVGVATCLEDVDKIIGGR